MSGVVTRWGEYRPLEGATLRVLCLGLGVQSTRLAEGFACGEIGPPPDFAIFADTTDEMPETYRLLRSLTAGNRKLPFPVHVVSRGSLSEDVLASALSWGDLGAAARADRAQWRRAKRVANPPLFTRGPRVAPRRVQLEALPLLGLDAEEVFLHEEFIRGDESFGFLGRKCTREFKIEVAEAELRRILDVPKGERVPPGVRVEYMLGITTDEISRIGGSSAPWITLTYPLIQLGESRTDCYGWFHRHELPIPAESGCFHCPFRDDRQWLAMKLDEPETFERACLYDEAIREGIRGTLHKLFLHSSRTPLRTVDFTRAHSGWAMEGFRNECAGRCNV